MKLSAAVSTFEGWSTPWIFYESVRSKLSAESQEAMTFEAVIAEATRREHWMQVDLAVGCDVARRETQKKFPDVDDRVIASVVRAASYDWR